MITTTRLVNVAGYLIVALVALWFLLRDTDRARRVPLLFMGVSAFLWSLFYGLIGAGVLLPSQNVTVLLSRVLHWFNWLIYGLFGYAMYLSKRLEE